MHYWLAKLIWENNTTFLGCRLLPTKTMKNYILCTNLVRSPRSVHLHTFFQTSYNFLLLSFLHHNKYFNLSWLCLLLLAACMNFICKQLNLKLKDPTIVLTNPSTIVPLNTSSSSQFQVNCQKSVPQLLRFVSCCIKVNIILLQGQYTCWVAYQLLLN